MSGCHLFKTWCFLTKDRKRVDLEGKEGREESGGLE